MAKRPLHDKPPAQIGDPLPVSSAPEPTVIPMPAPPTVQVVVPTIIPLTPGAGEINSQNETMLSLVMRRLRELVLDAQKRRGDGKIAIEVLVSAGMLNRTARVRPDWTERL